MNQSFYIGALGAQQQQKSLNVVGNNIANIGSHGFKAEKSRFTSLLYTNLETASEGLVKSGTGAGVFTTDTLFTTGGVMPTGRMQDYMIEGNGFFALQDLQTGEISYTRNGAFSMAGLTEDTGKKDANGNAIIGTVFYLSDGQGRFVLDSEGKRIKVEDPNAKYPVGVFDCANYNGIKHLDSTRFAFVDKNGKVVPSNAKLVQGALETSNVDLANEMTQVIEAQRSYSLALKIVSTSDEVESSIINLRG